MMHESVKAFLETLSDETIREMLDLFKMMQRVPPVELMKVTDELKFYLADRMEKTYSE